MSKFFVLQDECKIQQHLFFNSKEDYLNTTFTVVHLFCWVNCCLICNYINTCLWRMEKIKEKIQTETLIFKTYMASKQIKPMIRLLMVKCLKLHHIEVSLQFLAHLSWKLKWAFVIAYCLSSVHLSVISSSSQEPLGQFQPNLAQSILWWWGFKFLQMKGHALFQGEIIRK